MALRSCARPRRALALAAVVALALFSGLALWRAGEGAAPAAPAALAPAPSPAAVAPAPPAAPRIPGAQTADAMPPQARSRLRRQLAADLQLAEQAYCSYRAASRYPPGSRPLRENADQDRPNDPVVATDAMRLDGGGTDDRVQLQTSQSRVWLGAGETAAFALRAVDAGGRPLALAITGAQARAIAASGVIQAGALAVPFAEDGRGGFAAVLDPHAGALAGFDGTIRTEVRYSVDGMAGTVLFDVIHTPQLPAAWTGAVRDTLDDGSPAFVLALDVRRAGRYVVNGRVDDARGQPLALLTFDGAFGPGVNEVRLVASGKLVRDEDAVLPLTLRDVDGYLLKDGADPGPDRVLLPRLQGTVATGARHARTALSTAEWQGEERARYLAEFGRDLALARARLAAVDGGQPAPPAGFDPGAPAPPAACAPPPAPAPR